MNPFDKDAQEGGLRLSEASLFFLENVAKWARFLAIVGFILCGLMVVGGLFMFVAGAAISSRSVTGFYSRGEVFGGLSPAFLGIMYLLSSLLYFFPVLYLYNFARKMLNAIVTRDQLTLEGSFENLRNHYRFIGILTIIVMAIYALALVLGIFVAMAGGMR
jgi:hypothetical protein